MSAPRFLVCLGGVMVVIFVIDWVMGATAEHLNAYEIVRRTFDLPLPMISERYIFGGLGLPMAWLAWVVEAAIPAAVLTWLVSR